MTFLILWGGLWAALLVLRAVAVAMTPTTVSNPVTLSAALWCGGISLVAAVTLHGAFSLIWGIFT